MKSVEASVFAEHCERDGANTSPFFSRKKSVLRKNACRKRISFYNGQRFLLITSFSNNPNVTIIKRMNKVITAAKKYCCRPTEMPTDDTAHKPAAVVIPSTPFSPLKITPAQRIATQVMMVPTTGKVAGKLSKVVPTSIARIVKAAAASPTKL